MQSCYCRVIGNYSESLKRYPKKITIKDTWPRMLIVFRARGKRLEYFG